MVIQKQILLILLIVNTATYAFANEVNSKLAIRAIVGEASNQGYVGMLALAGAIRNRKSLKGVYGLHSKHVNQEPSWVWQQAKKAWLASANKDTSNGATNWENIKAFGKPKWAKEMVVTATVKDHVFMKERI